MTWRLRIRKNGVSPLFDCDPAKFQTRTVGVLILAVQVKVFSEKFQAGLFFKVYLTKHLKVAYVRHGIGSDVLRMEVGKAQNVFEELRAGR